MDTIHIVAAANGIDCHTFQFHRLTNDEKLDKLKEIVEKTKNNTKTLYTFAGDEDLNHISDYIGLHVKEIKGKCVVYNFACNNQRFVFFDGSLLVTHDHDAYFWGQYLTRTRENKCCVCLAEDLHFFQNFTCLKACSAVLCSMCICTLPNGTCPLCRKKDAYSCLNWDPDVDDEFSTPRTMLI